MADATHGEISEPHITLRLLADYMAATSTAQRSILRNCKYPPIARFIHHNEAREIVTSFIRSGSEDTAVLDQEAEQLRLRPADTPFDRDLYDHNADYVARYAKVHPRVALPAAEIQAPGDTPVVDINGVKVGPEIHFRLQRQTRTNEIRIGAGILRYQKGRALSAEVGAWQSAIILGYLRLTTADDNKTPDGKLCLTIDAYSGTVLQAPGNAKHRFNQVESSCKTIAELWPAIKSPPGAVC